MKTRSFDPEFTRTISSAEWMRCEELIKQFEDAWREGRTPSIKDYLIDDPEVRRALLVELVYIDLEFHYKYRDPACIEGYFNDFPELASDSVLFSDLLVAEHRLRHRYKAPVERSEYVRRFPSISPALLERLTASDILSTGSAAGSNHSELAGWPDVPFYEIVAQIGRGGMGIVYKARDPSLDRFVALKFLPPEYSQSSERLQRFLHEARTASSLNHPNICMVHSLGEHEERPFLVLEFVEGRTLRELAAAKPSISDCIGWIRQAARALAAAHAAGIVHRDIKPENIMVRGDGFVKVVDFGLARRLPTLAGAQHLSPDTDVGTMLGTVAYMSPEQTRGVPAEVPSDIFSLGIVAYQLLAGRHPFDAATTLAMLNAISTSQAVSLARVNPEIPVEVSNLIDAMLHKDPQLRPTAAEVEALLSLAGRGGNLGPARPAAHRAIVQREPELKILRRAFSDADAGRGSVICIAGEPGIGKTTLVEDFLDELSQLPTKTLIAAGNCSERLAEAEAYLPVTDALENLLKSDVSGSAARLLRAIAPAWYSIVAPMMSDSVPADQHARAFSQPALLREVYRFFHEATRLGTIVLFLDDVHWSDHATVDLLAHLGKQSRELRLLIVVTYRPTEMLLSQHPFRNVKLELQGRGVCSEIELGFLTQRDVRRYLDLAFPEHDFPAELAEAIHSRTEGSPLFMVDLLRYLKERGVLAEADGRWSMIQKLPDFSRELPASIRGMIERKIDQLQDDERRLMAAASVQGQTFDSAIVGDALGQPAADVEERLQSLERVHGFVRLVLEQELPDRTLNLRYRFVHALYQQAILDSLSPARRADLSTALAKSLEAHYGSDSSSVAAQLACLYEVGRNYSRSAWQFWLAAQNAGRMFAHGEAISLARRGIRLLEATPASAERDELELRLQTTLGLQYQVTEGYAAPAARQAYERARKLCTALADKRHLFPVLWGLWLYYKVHSELNTAQRFANELTALSLGLNDPDLALQAHQALAMTAFCRGFDETALHHVEQVAVLYDRTIHGTHAFHFGQDPGVICKAFGAVVLWLLGYPDQAARQSHQAIAASDELSPTSQAVALFFAAMVHQLRREPAQTREFAEQCAAIAIEHGLSFWLAGSSIFRGWALAEEGEWSEGISIVRQGLLDWQATGSVTYRTYFLGLLAELLLRQGRLTESGRLLDEALALARETDERFYEPELCRLNGEVLLAGVSPGGTLPVDGEPRVRRALTLAQRRAARSLELRAAMSLVQHCQRHQLPCDGPREQLKNILEWFVEGRESFDVKAATALVAQ